MKTEAEAYDDQPELPEKHEALLDAEQWERSDLNALYEACVRFINAGLVPDQSGVTSEAFINSDEKLVVSRWTQGGPEWNSARRFLIKRARLARQSRKNRKRIQGRLLLGMPPYDESDTASR